jgi:hypothetical protein
MGFKITMAYRGILPGQWRLLWPDRRAQSGRGMPQIPFLVTSPRAPYLMLGLPYIERCDHY